jgi:hypothetical protein
MANAGLYRHKDVEGPITYVPIRLQCPNGEIKNIYLFGDMHVNITSCGEREIHHSKLIGNTLRYFKDIDFFAEIGFGSEKENTFTKETPTDTAHIFFTFTTFFQKGCFKQPVDGRCLANFPNSRFHNIDFRQTLQYECKKEFANVSRELGMGDLFTIPKEVVNIFLKLDHAISERKKTVVKRFLEKLKITDIAKYNQIIKNAGEINSVSQFNNYVIDSCNLDEEKIISPAFEQIRPEFAHHEAGFKKLFLEEYPDRLETILDSIEMIYTTEPNEKRSSILRWVHFLLSIQLTYVRRFLEEGKVYQNPLGYYTTILKFFMKPFDGESFDILYRESMLSEDIYLYKYGRAPYYQYKFNNMIKKTDHSLHAPLEKMLKATFAKMKDVNQRTGNYIADMSAMLDLFFIIRLFENFAQVPDQPSGPINRVIAYVGAAHVPNIIKLLKMTGVDMFSPGKFYTTENGIAMIAPFDENIKIDLSNSQCIKIPLQEVQIDGQSALILPEEIHPLGDYDILEYRKGVNARDSPKVYPILKPKLLNTNDKLVGEITEDSEIYQKYIRLSRNLQKRINQLLTLTKDDPGKHRTVLELLKGDRPITEILLDETQRAFAFRAKRSKKAKKSVKKSRKSKKSVKKSSRKPRKARKRPESQRKSRKVQKKSK